MAETRILIAQNDVQNNYNHILERIDNAKKIFKDKPYDHAQCDSILGDVYRLTGRYKEADKIYNEAAKLFTDNMYLSEIGITWYKIAQNHSQSGNKKEALEALDKAIYYDRCAENSMALGADYYIKGVILLKGNPTDKEIKEAKTSLLHSSEIYNAANMSELAAKSLDLLKTLE
jgi:tetratricopeptide (TPR) repeat protein